MDIPVSVFSLYADTALRIAAETQLFFLVHLTNLDQSTGETSLNKK